MAQVTKTPTQPTNTWKLAAIVLAILFALLAVKYLWSRVQWNRYALQAQEKVMSYPPLNSAEDGAMIATTVASFPVGNPLYKNPDDLERYVTQINTQTGRDLVVVDKAKTILADTVSGNVGSMYTDDRGDEVSMTIADGKPRTFTETSKDYPKGITEEVVPMKNSPNGQTIGAVLISSSQIFK